MNKVFPSPEAAVADVPNGSLIGVGGFGVAHRYPTSLLTALRDSTNATDLGLVGNTPGAPGDLRFDLTVAGRVSRLLQGFAPRPGQPAIDEAIATGRLTIEIVPQGTMVERCRAAAAGIPAFYTPTAAGTLVAEGKDVRYFDGKPYVMERALALDYAFVRAYRADSLGNTQFREASQNFGPSFCKAARVAIVEVDEVVDVGAIAPDDVDLPGIFVDRVIKKTIDVPHNPSGGQLRRRPAESAKKYLGRTALTRSAIARNAASLLPSGAYVNLGIGIPTMVSNYLAGRDVILHAENGVLGYGEMVSGDGVDPDVYNAGGQFVTLTPGASFFDSVTSFEMARSGRLSAVILGGFQVDAEGSLANWKTDESRGGVGGAMDLVAGGCTLIVTMEHRDSRDRPKLVRACQYPVTARSCVDIVVTDLAILRRQRGATTFALEAIAPGFTVEEVLALTDMDLRVAGEVATMV
ncbi:MAG: 3-oxoacid CoA-transferase [Chloroflexota bacterium]